jgi:hypothetical protein
LFIRWSKQEEQRTSPSLLLHWRPPWQGKNTCHPMNVELRLSGYFITRMILVVSVDGLGKMQTPAIVSGVVRHWKWDHHYVWPWSLTKRSQILGAYELVNSESLVSFLNRCQFKYGGICKAPGENPGTRNSSVETEYWVLGW